MTTDREGGANQNEHPLEGRARFPRSDVSAPASQVLLQRAGKAHGALAFAVRDGESGALAANAVRAVPDRCVLSARNRGYEPKKDSRI